MFPARAPCAAQGALGEARLQGCPYAVWLEPRPEVPILPAVVVRVPHIGQGHDLSGEPERLERAEGLEKDRALQGRVSGLTGLVIQREVQEDRSRWPNRKGDVPGRGHASVGIPAFSISRAVSPTDWWQTGQTGTRSTASTAIRRSSTTIFAARSISRLAEYDVTKLTASSARPPMTFAASSSRRRSSGNTQFGSRSGSSSR